jgi:hypothetical protein
MDPFHSQGVTMKIARFRQPIVSALAVLLVSGAGVAFAGNSSSIGNAALAASPAAAASEPAETVDGTEPVEATGLDTDNVQAGDQTGSDAAGIGAAAVQASKVGAVAPKARVNAGAMAPKKAVVSSAASAAETGTETGTETTGTEEPGDVSLPGGGNADNPNDPNVDHQFDGVE